MKGEFAWALNDERSVTKSDILERLKASLAFSKDVESTNLCNANYYVIQAVLRVSAKRRENRAKLRQQGLDLGGLIETQGSMMCFLEHVF
jgi:hypothetical protein